MISTLNPTLLAAIPLAPLAAALLAGLAGKTIGRAASAAVTLTAGHAADYDGTLYTWLVTDGVHMQVGFLVDHLTALMMVVVTFVSLCVHVYTIGYMHDDPGYQRFFAYISLFTFAMLMLVMSNNFMQLFFGWEAVGV